MKKLFSVVLAVVLGLSLTLRAQDSPVKDKEVKDKVAIKSAEPQTVYQVTEDNYVSILGYPVTMTVVWIVMGCIVAIVGVWWTMLRKKPEEGTEGSSYPPRS